VYAAVLPLADYTATVYDWLLARYCPVSSVCDEAYCG